MAKLNNWKPFGGKARKRMSSKPVRLAKKALKKKSLTTIKRSSKKMVTKATRAVKPVLKGNSLPKGKRALMLKKNGAYAGHSKYK